ncbi:FAD-linked oxidoreductase ZEB1-like [Lingula anatina]|uniref:FAD-linked oxidoreductase ZEB1-like n=1 Tax=Lingula anatina TaxID=7574 RepID=A0A2R2MN82_LINAN|nr:FAD-linked oxidoreductase ZEB1-like [Lingula anatina]XP_023931517.1 FAD-linked oxidoreductase ZEB1-like [Lingula anatina]|eukprot:XP_023931516.1 FAD-linked oxidoreductase ZEB1-like [Lingula anatina]
MIVPLFVVFVANLGLCHGYCTSDESCWPSSSRQAQLKASLSGKLYLTGDTNFSAIAKVVYNTRYAEKPAIIVEPYTDQDVQKVIVFANEFNIRISVVSSGHDYIGRNTAANNIQINMSKMKYLKVNLNDSASDTGMSATTEMGNFWGAIYEEVSGKYNKLIVGGSSETVSPAGYTLGGGHSPLTRKLGLAVDNVLEITVVTAEGYIANLTSSSTVLVDKNGVVNTSTNTDLFWALRGGGGSTFGVVTRIKYRIHDPPADGFVYATCSYRYRASGQMVGPTIMDYFNSFITTLPNEFGGYYLIHTPLQYNPPYVYIPTEGLVTLAFEIFGNLSFANPYMETIKSYRSDWRYGDCSIKNYTRWWDYRKDIHDKGSFSRVYIFNSLLPSSSFDNGLTDIIETYYQKAYDSKYFIGCTGVLIGGKATEYSSDSSSVGDALRNSFMSMSCGLPWPDSLAYMDGTFIDFMLPFQNEMIAKGNGVYYNEPSSRLSNWRTQYWGTKYSRLEGVKKTWDPNSRFTCCHCVGSDGDAHCSAVKASAKALVLGFLLVLTSIFTR